MKQNIKSMVTTNYMKRILTMAIVFLFTLGAWADPTVTIIKKLNGVTATTSSPGDATSNVSEGVCTLTVTPVSGNYVTSEFITVSSTVTGDMAQVRQQSPNMDVSTITDKHLCRPQRYDHLYLYDAYRRQQRRGDRRLPVAHKCDSRHDHPVKHFLHL